MLVFELHRSNPTYRSFLYVAFEIFNSAWCYFVVTTASPHIIQHLYDFGNNTPCSKHGSVYARFLQRKLSWLQSKALVILTIGTMVTQLSGETSSALDDSDSSRSPYLGYSFVIVSAIASGAGGVFS